MTSETKSRKGDIVIISHLRKVQVRWKYVAEYAFCFWRKGYHEINFFILVQIYTRIEDFYSEEMTHKCKDEEKNTTVKELPLKQTVNVRKYKWYDSLKLYIPKQNLD